MTASNNNRSQTGDTETMGVLDLVQKRLNNGVLVVGAAGSILGFSPNAPALLGMTAADLQHGSLRDLPASVREALERSLSTRTALAREEVIVPTSVGTPSVLGLDTVLTGQPTGAVLVVSLSDLRVVQKIEERVEQVDRLASVGTLAAGMGHEIKNAMVAVTTFVEMLLHQNKDAELAALVGRELKRIDSLVSQMLRFAGPARAALSHLRLHETLDHSLQLVQRQAVARQVEIVKQFTAKPDFVRGDNYQLQQAFLNLLLNALDAMPSGGRLTLQTTFAPASEPYSAILPPMVRVEIRDTGCGIAQENLPRLFEPFFTTKPNGNGLGLAITQRIIREHSGEITVQSSPGQGTAFQVILPSSAPNS